MAAVPTAEVVVLNMPKPPMRLSELRGGDMVLLNIGSVLIGRLAVTVAVVVRFAWRAALLLLLRRGSRKSSKQSRPGRKPSMSGDPRGDRSKERSKSRSSKEFVELGGDGGNWAGAASIPRILGSDCSLASAASRPCLAAGSIPVPLLLVRLSPR